MASDQSYVDYIREQADLPDLSYRKMFGEYALYLHGKVIALVCDNQLFLKPTPEGRALLNAVSEHPPFPGARPHFRLDEELDERELLQRLFLATARVLPPPKPKGMRNVKAKPKKRKKATK